MEFEKKFKNKIQKKIIEQIEEDFQKDWEWFDQLKEDVIEDEINYTLSSIREFINLYNSTISDKNKQLHFYDKDITVDSLMDLKRKIQLTQNEKEYIEYETQIGRASYPYESRYIEAIIEVLIRRLLVERMDIPDLTDFDGIIEEKLNHKDRLVKNYLHVKSLISGEIFEEDGLSKMISDRVEEEFNWRLNCGGYALEIETCIFPGENDFEKNVSSILELFPFVRLLGDTELEEDEYLVLFRCAENGHHFIKRTDDGIFLEKDARNPTKRFESWGECLANSPEAAFAVKKEHDTEWHGTIMIPIEGAKNFEESVVQAIKEKQNTFEYHNHTYQLKKSNEGIIYVCSNDKIVAQVLIDEKDFDIEIDEQSRKYISNTEPSAVVIGEGEKQDGKGNNIEGDLYDR